MEQLVIFSMSNNLIGLKNKIFNLLISDGREINNNILYLDNSNVSIDIIKETLSNNNIKKMVLVVEEGVNIHDSIIEEIKTKVGCSLSTYSYDTTSSIGNLKDINSNESYAYDELFKMYYDGYSEEHITEFLDLKYCTFDDFMDIVIEKHIKNNSNRLSEELKKAVSNRDKAGIPRKSIANELNVNYKTIQRACEKYGNANKNMDKSDDRSALDFVTSEYDIDNVKKTLICPKCKKPTNNIELGWGSDNYYCKNCLEEYFIMPSNDNVKSVFRVKWENIN